MSVTDSAAESVDIDFELKNYDGHLVSWGRWWYHNGGGLDDLGYARINVLHPKHGLGGGSDYQEMDEDQLKTDRIVKQLPASMRVVAQLYWVEQMTKKNIALYMTVWMGKHSKPKNVKSFHVDNWINAIGAAVYWGIGRKD